MVETPKANLSKGMRQLNGVYTQRFNRRHAPGRPCLPGPLQVVKLPGQRRAGRPHPAFVDAPTLLGRLAGSLPAARRRYVAFVEAGMRT